MLHKCIIFVGNKNLKEIHVGCLLRLFLVFLVVLCLFHIVMKLLNMTKSTLYVTFYF